MASTASPAAPPSAHALKPGVAPLRAGEGTSFLLRRLHSLSGVIPIGAFLLEHFISNAEAFKGPIAYGKQVEFLNSLPGVFLLELFFIWIPILYHALYGIYIWYRARVMLRVIRGAATGSTPRNAGRASSPSSTWCNTPGTCASPGVHLPTHPMQAFAKVQGEFQNPLMVAFYAVGIIAASWHFSYGLWLFAAKWGITTGERARRRFGYVCAALALGLILIGRNQRLRFLAGRPINRRKIIPLKIL